MFIDAGKGFDLFVVDYGTGSHCGVPANLELGQIWLASASLTEICLPPLPEL